MTAAAIERLQQQQQQRQQQPHLNLLADEQLDIDSRLLATTESNVVPNEPGSSREGALGSNQHENHERSVPPSLLPVGAIQGEMLAPQPDVTATGAGVPLELSALLLASQRALSQPTPAAVPSMVPLSSSVSFLPLANAPATMPSLPVIGSHATLPAALAAHVGMAAQQQQQHRTLYQVPMVTPLPMRPLDRAYGTEAFSFMAPPPLVRPRLLPASLGATSHYILQSLPSLSTPLELASESAATTAQQHHHSQQPQPPPQPQGHREPLGSDEPSVQDWAAAASTTAAAAAAAAAATTSAAAPFFAQAWLTGSSAAPHPLEPLL